MLGLAISLTLHPIRHSLSRLLFEGIAERAVNMETTLYGQLLSSEGLLSSDSLTIEPDEMLDAQIVDIGIVIDVLTGEILAEIDAIGANQHGKLRNGNVMLQI